MSTILNGIRVVAVPHTPSEEGCSHCVFNPKVGRTNCPNWGQEQAAGFTNCASFDEEGEGPHYYKEVQDEETQQ